MDVVIAGGHGKIGMRLGALLAARGDAVRGIIRNAEQSDDLRVRGMHPLVCNLEVTALDAVVTAVRGWRHGLPRPAARS